MGKQRFAEMAPKRSVTNGKACLSTELHRLTVHLTLALHTRLAVGLVV